MPSHAVIIHSYGGKSTWPVPRGVSILTWPADVLNLQVFVGGQARVAEHTVSCHHATLSPILTPRERRDVTYNPHPNKETKTTSLTYFFVSNVRGLTNNGNC